MKISIIFPIFNQEKYLQQAIDSVKNQTIGFENIELILVDDCSTDKTKEIIIKNANEYDNIKPIFLDSNSGGAGIPKNKGIENATSPYLMFMDPDDYLLENSCEVLYNEIHKEKSDIVAGNALQMKNGELFIDLDRGNDTKEIIHPIKDYSTLKPHRIWASIYSREFVLKNDLRFLNKKTNEDTYFCLKSYFNADKISYLNKHFGYIYMIRDNGESLTNIFDKTTLISTIDAFLTIKKMLVSENIKLDYDPCLFNCFTRLGSKWDVSREEEKEVFDKILEYENELRLPIRLPIQYKIAQYLLINHRFGLLHYYHILFSKICSVSLIVSLLRPQKRLESESELYKKIMELKLF